jgi:hypothetical protein
MKVQLLIEAEFVISLAFKVFDIIIVGFIRLKKQSSISIALLVACKKGLLTIWVSFTLTTVCFNALLITNLLC